MIAEDQTMVRQALVALLGLEGDIEVVGEAASGDEALAMARLHRPAVALLDIEMPGPDGIEVARQLAADGFSGKTIIVTTFGRPGHAPPVTGHGPQPPVGRHTKARRPQPRRSGADRRTQGLALTDPEPA